MPKPLSKITDENMGDLEMKYVNSAYIVPGLVVPSEDAQSHLSSSESHIIEGIKEWAEANQWNCDMAISTETVVTLSELIDFLDEGLTGNK